MEDLFKYITPIFAIIYTINYLRKIKSNNTKLLCALFLSYTCFSSNYNWDLRYIHQIFIGYICILAIKNINKWKNLKETKYFTLIFICIIISFLINNGYNSGYAISNLINFITCALTTIWVIISIKKNETKITTLLEYIINITLLISIFTILLSLLSSTKRVELTFSNPNYLAFFIGFGTVLYSYFKYKGSNVDIIKIILLCSAILMTGSRSILFVIIPILIYIIYIRNKLHLIIIIAMVITFLPSNIHKIEDTIRITNIDEDDSINQRRQIFLVVKQIAEEHTFFGIGYGKFIVIFKEYIPYNAELLFKVDQIVTHNDYYRIIAELGIVGFISFLFIILKSCLISLKNKRYRVLLLSLLLLSLSFSFTHNNLNTFIFWLILFIPFTFEKYNYYKLN